MNVHEHDSGSEASNSANSAEQTRDAEVCALTGGCSTGRQAHVASLDALWAVCLDRNEATVNPETACCRVVVSLPSLFIQPRSLGVSAAKPFRERLS